MKTLKILFNKIDKIFGISNLNSQIKTLYNQMKNKEFKREKIDSLLRESIQNFDKTYQIYLLKKMSYKEEFEIYKSRQSEMINENKDSKKEYNDINCYLINFKVDVNGNENYKKFKNLIQTIYEYNNKK